MKLGRTLVVRGIPTSGQGKRNQYGPVVADCLNEKIFPARVHGGWKRSTSSRAAPTCKTRIRDLLPDAIARDTMDFRTPPQETMPVEPQAREVTLQTHGHDKYKRTLADVLLPDGTNVNRELVKDGWCWWYRKYAPADTVLEGLEREAREGKKGLWADPQPVPPWEVAEAEIAFVGRLISWRWRGLQLAALSAGHGSSGLNNIYSGEAQRVFRGRVT